MSGFKCSAHRAPIARLVNSEIRYWRVMITDLSMRGGLSLILIWMIGLIKPKAQGDISHYTHTCTALEPAPAAERHGIRTTAAAETASASAVTATRAVAGLAAEATAARSGHFKQFWRHLLSRLAHDVHQLGREAAVL